MRSIDASVEHVEAVSPGVCITPADLRNWLVEIVQELVRL